MGTSIESGRGSGGGGGGEGPVEEEEEEVIPWSCVDETIREELIIRLNPEHVMSGNNWRGLAGRLDYTTAQIMAIESEKGNNTREFFNSYNLKGDSSFNEVYQALKEMERIDCINILDKYLPRIRRNVQMEKEKEARILEESMSTPQPPPCPYHYLQTPQHSMGVVGGSCVVGCSHLSRPMGAHHVCSMPPPAPHSHPPHHDSYSSHCNSSNNAGHPSSPCCHMGAMTHHPLQMAPPQAPSCMAAAAGATCGNQSPTKTCSFGCARQQSCTPPHLQMDISQSIPVCSGTYCYPPSTGRPASSATHSSMVFSDPSHPNHNSNGNSNGNSMINAPSPTSHVYYNVRDPSSYSPKISPDTNTKPYNFTVPGACPPDMIGSHHTGSGVRGFMDHRMSGNHVMEQQNHRNIVINNNRGGEPDHLFLSNTSTSDSSHFHSNENNMSYPTSSSSMPHYHSNGGSGTDMMQHHHQQQQQQQQQHNHPHAYYQVPAGAAAASASSKSMSHHHHQNSAMDSKKSLQKLAEISKMPNKYQPTKEYKTFVAEQDVENKRQRSRNARGSGNGSIISSSSSNSTASSSSSSSGQPMMQNRCQPEELPQMAGLSIDRQPSMSNTITNLSSNVYVTYSKDNEGHKKDVLRLTIFLKDNDNSVWADVATDPALLGRDVEPYQEFYDLADFILVCISPKYLQDIAKAPSYSPSSPQPSISSSTTPSATSPTSLPIHTFQIYQMMKKEHQLSASLTQSSAASATAAAMANGINGTESMRNITQHRENNNSSSSSSSSNQRFVSLLFGDMTKDHVPSWLRKYPIYKWPQDYEHIGWFLKKPKERICAQAL